MSLDIFKDIMPSILLTKDYLNIEENEKDYNPFVVNKVLTQQTDTLYYAKMMNINSHLDKKIQYDYLFHSVRKYKRQPQKWLKNTDPKELKILMEYYQCSSAKAKTILSVLTPENLEIIEKRLDKGGNYKTTK